MNPETLLAILVQARGKLPTELDTHFVLLTVRQALPSLLHPMLPDGGILIDRNIQNALQLLVQWGYLAQSEYPNGHSYLLTAAGLNYAARIDGSVWDGTERRQRERRSGRDDLMHPEMRRVERRRGLGLPTATEPMKTVPPIRLRIP